MNAVDEMGKRTGKEYSIMKDGVVIPATLTEWENYRGLPLEESGRHIAQDKVGDYLVSTVFMGYNHNYFEGPPLWFETMIFDENEKDCGMDRYETLEEAKLGHQRMIEKTKTLSEQTK